MWNHHVFSQLVNNDADFVGYVAYSIYKSEKIKWIKDIYAQENTYPNKQTIETYFILPNSSQASIERYRSQAENQLNSFMKLTLQEELSIYRDALKEDTIIKEIKRSKKKFWPAVLESTLATFFSTLIIIGLSFLLWWNSSSDSQDKESIINQSPLPTEIKKN